MNIDIINRVRIRFIQKRIRSFKRWYKNHRFQIAAMVVLLFSAVFAYAGYMGNQQLSVNPKSYTPLLNVIAKAESNGNYNAYFGNPGNSQIDFTSMSVTDVLKWQKDYVAQGSASSAVGRYQFINGTLQGLVDQLDIHPDQKFDPPMQDTLAIALLERRGSLQYVNEELSAEDFAANLAKEWAGLPKVVGDKPDQSYYTGDGLNKSRVMPQEVLKAIEPIEAK